MYFFNNILYVIGLPIGNFFDFSNRSIFILKNVDFIVSEDSRKIGYLLSFFNLKNKIIVINSYNESIIAIELINYILSGYSAAIVSDAGTPCISDPGQIILKHAYINSIKVIPIPGPSIISTVISICSFKVDKFIFFGFLPKKRVYKEIIFKKINFNNFVYIFFESSKRLLSTLLLAKTVLFFNKKVFLAKDLTKKFEYVLVFNLFDFDFNFFSENLNLNKGEFVLLFSKFNANFYFNINLNTNMFLNLIKKEKFFKFVVFSSLIKNDIFLNF